MSLQKSTNEKDSVEYRLVYGASVEGLSIRDIYYDRNHKVVAWGRKPLSIPAQSKEEIVSDILDAIRQLDDMLEATKKPVLDELKLEAKLGKKN